jgi:hypothetical protein
MNPETAQTLNSLKQSLHDTLVDLNDANYGLVKQRLEQLYIQIAVQSTLFNTNLDEMEFSSPQIIDCILTDEVLACE